MMQKEENEHYAEKGLTLEAYMWYNKFVRRAVRPAVFIICAVRKSTGQAYRDPHGNR